MKAKVKWERDLLPDTVRIDSYFSCVKYTCISRENKLREFYFKLLHRIVVTKRELHLFGIENEMLCIYCRENDSIIHTFSNCHWSREFFLEVIKWFNKENDTSFSSRKNEIVNVKLANSNSVAARIRINEQKGVLIAHRLMQ